MPKLKGLAPIAQDLLSDQGVSPASPINGAPFVDVAGLGVRQIVTLTETPSDRWEGVEWAYVYRATKDWAIVVPILGAIARPSWAEKVPRTKVTAQLVSQRDVRRATKARPSGAALISRYQPVGSARGPRALLGVRVPLALVAREEGPEYAVDLRGRPWELGALIRAHEVLGALIRDLIERVDADQE